MASFMRLTSNAKHFSTEKVSNLDIEYEDIFSQNIQKRKAIVALFLTLFNIKEDIKQRECDAGYVLYFHILGNKCIYIYSTARHFLCILF